MTSSCGLKLWTLLTSRTTGLEAIVTEGIALTKIRRTEEQWNLLQHKSLQRLAR
jgi:hypothetical protein